LEELAGPSVSPRSGGTPTSLVVMLHGRGSNGDDLIGLAGVMGDDFPGAAFHAPNAPYEVGGFGFQWYSIGPAGDKPHDLRANEPMINGFIDGLLAEYGLVPAQCILLGFSQGAVTSIHTGPRRATPLAGVVAFSGGMSTGDTLVDELKNRSPFVLIHGAEDQVLPASGTEEAGRRLDEVGVPVEVHILPGLGHTIDRRGLDIASEFMKRVLTAS
jgi:phospholipase/carboxylesterase